MTKHPAISAGVLIGGKSARMGADKATLPWKGSTLLETVVRTARQWTDDCVLLGSAERLPDSLADMPRLPDSYTGIGPIAGLHALLICRRDTWCLLLSCDVPGVTIQTISALLDHIESDISVVAYATSPISTKPTDSNSWDTRAQPSKDHTQPSSDRLEPCCALYHSSILPEVERAITTRRYSLRALIKSVPHTTLPVDPATRTALHNINYPQDYTDPV